MNAPATRGELFATRDELRAEILSARKAMGFELSKIYARYETQESAIRKEINDATNRLAALLDHNTKIVEALHRAYWIHGSALTEHDKLLEDHGRRIGRLEKS